MRSRDDDELRKVETLVGIKEEEKASWAAIIMSGFDFGMRCVLGELYMDVVVLIFCSAASRPYLNQHVSLKIFACPAGPSLSHL